MSGCGTYSIEQRAFEGIKRSRYASTLENVGLRREAYQRLSTIFEGRDTAHQAGTMTFTGRVDLTGGSRARGWYTGCGAVVDHGGPTHGTAVFGATICGNPRGRGHLPLNLGVVTGMWHASTRVE